MTCGKDASYQGPQLSVAKQALLERWTRGEPLSPRVEDALAKRWLPGPAPLSSAQERLWFLNELQPDNPAYNVPIAFHLVGPLDTAALERSLTMIVERHEALRTTFVASDEGPRQVIASAEPVVLSIVDMANFDKPDREDDVLRRAVEEIRRPFALTRAPLLRAILFQLDEQEHLLLMVMHHIVCDAWSLGILLRELSAFYTAHAVGDPIHLRELPVQYADYASWQRKRLQDGALSPQLAYWRQQLAASPLLLTLPTIRPRPPIQTFRGAHYPFVLSQSLHEGLTQLSRREGVTLFITLLAAFQALIHRYSGQEDVVVGTPIANRARPEIEGLIGFFANTLVLRTDLADNPPFRQLLARVREIALDAFSHQDLPFEKLVEELRPERDLSRNPLFQIMFAFQNAPMEMPHFPGLTVHSVPIESGVARFDLTLSMQEGETGLSGVVEYNTDLFDSVTIARLVDHLKELLKGITADPNKRLSELPLLTPEETSTMLIEWNPGSVAPTQGQSIHERFEAQAQQTPDAVALVCGGEQLTYADLNARANQLAHHLRKLGVGPEMLVGICVERSTDMVVGVLGILKAGGAYVPLDPMQPSERIALIADDAAISILVIQERLKTKLAVSHACIVCLDADWGVITRESKLNPSHETVLDHLAYVIYTSGSTGRPKGVLISHRSVVRLFEATHSLYHFDCNDVWTLFHSFAFDFSVWELWGALLHGGKLVIVSYEVSRSPEAFCALVCNEGVTILNQTPSAFRHFMWAEVRMIGAAPLALRLIIFGGEALDRQEIQPWLERHGDRAPRLVNMYGITETTVHVTAHPLQKTDTCQPTGSVIGRPFPDRQVFVLDRYLQPVPIGIPGEIYVGGSGIARGYLNRPELTAERFVPHPLSDVPGSRLYRTGDQARWLADGNLDFLGRLDSQVKVRGFRIELGEIEAALAQYPLVGKSVVIPWEDTPDSSRLIAYVVPHHGATVSARDLREFLKTKLPDYMMPAVIVPMEALPINANGKVDRKLLPVPFTSTAQADADFVAPRTPIEEMLAAIWTEVLMLDRVSVNANFFDLGGDSIRSIQVVIRARRAGMDLTPTLLFQHQTIAELAIAMGSLAQVAIQPDGASGPLPLTPVQRLAVVRSLVDGQICSQERFLEVPATLEKTHLARAFTEIVRHHEALRLRVSSREGGWRQTSVGVDDAVEDMRAGRPIFSSVDLSSLPEDERNRAINQLAAEARSSLSVEHGPLIRAIHIGFGADEPGCLLIVLHQVVADGRTWLILLEDLAVAYEDLRRGGDAYLVASTDDFTRWIAISAAYTRREEFKQKAVEWLARLESAVSPSAPGDSTNGFGDFPEAIGELIVGLSVDETRALQLAPAAYRAKIDDLLLGALAQAFARWNGKRTLLLEIEGSGRELTYGEAQTQRTVGCFTFRHPLTLSLPEGHEPDIMIKSVKEQLCEARRNTFGYGLLCDLSGDEAIAAQLEVLPRPDVFFRYREDPDLTLRTTLQLKTKQAAETVKGSPSLPTDRALSMDVTIADGRLRIVWSYNKQRYDRAAIEELARHLLEALQRLSAHCLTPGTCGYTPSDFPLARLDQEEIDRLFGSDRDIEDVYPFGPFAEYMFFRCLTAPEPGLYVGYQVMHLRGIDLDTAAFERAWQHVVERHSIARTSFIWEGMDRPLQVVHRSAELSLELRDWRGASRTEQERRVEAYVEKERRQGFDWSRPPQWRLTICRCEEDSYYFVWRWNYILQDGWTYALIIKEAFAFYEALRREQELYPEPRPPYREYIEWLQHQDLAQAEAYWRRVLNGFTTPTPLVDTAQCGHPTAEDGYVNNYYPLGESTSLAVRSLARQQQLTLNTLLQGAWAIVLSYFCNEQDVVFGSVVSGRPTELRGSEYMVGNFHNLLPVRARIPREVQIVPWLKQFQSQLAEMRQYEYTPPQRVLQWSDIAEDRLLFESYVVFENFPVDPYVYERLAAYGADVRGKTQTEHPLRVLAWPGRALAPGSALMVVMSYHRRCFAAETIEKLLRLYEAVLDGLATYSEDNLGDLLRTLGTV